MIVAKYLNKPNFIQPIPVAARCNAWVRTRSLAGTEGSNPAGGMDVCLLCVLCVVSATGLSLVRRSPPECDLETLTMRRPRTNKVGEP